MEPTAPVDIDKLRFDGYTIEFSSNKEKPVTYISAICPDGYLVECQEIYNIQQVTKGFQKVRRAIKRHKKRKWMGSS